MRNNVAFLVSILVAILATPLAVGHGGSTVHSENVSDAHHLPAMPVAGQSVSIHLYVVDDTKIESVSAVYCRVQRYACAPALPLVKTSPLIYDGFIAWNSNNADFFRGVTDVGYKFEIRYIDGTNETTPLTHYPDRPADLPEGGDTYYYYTLEPAPGSPSVGFIPILAIALFALAWRKRH